MAQEITRAQKIGMIVGMQLTLLLAALDQTIVSTAMPRIIAELNGFSRYAWVTAAYLLTSTAALPIFGKLSDMYGRKGFLVGGAIGFVLSSVLCGMAGFFPSWLGDGMTQLIIFRGLQGIAGGIIMALTFTVIGDIFPPRERGKYQGLFSAVFALASVVGPALGGFITDNLSWRWVFYINLPVGLVAITVLHLAFPHLSRERHAHSLDLGGAVTLLGWVTPLLLALTWLPLHGMQSPQVLAALQLSALMFVIFVFIESQAVEPIIPFGMFTNSIVLVSSISLLITGVAMFGAILFLPLFLQSVLGLSATHSGSVLTPMMLAMTVGSIICGQIVSRTGVYKVICLVGIAIMTVGMFLLSTMTPQTHPTMAVGYTLLMGSGLGLLMPVYTLVVQNVAPQQMLGVATASVQFFRSIGATLGSAIFSSIMLARYAEHFHQHLPQGTPSAASRVFENPLNLQMVDKALASIPGVSPNMVAQLMIDLKDSLTYAIVAIFDIATILCVLAFVVNLFLKEVPLRKKHDTVSPAPADPEVVI
jgi:EmrB/QacA subfamily drug resistance transporter